MKILMVLHTPWTRRLGLSRCCVELAEEFRALGHTVDKFDLRDAFPRTTRVEAALQDALFARRAVAFVRQHGHRYDVIQAEQGNLPVPRRTLGFDGILACRSDGLVHFYVEWLRERRRAGVPQVQPFGTLTGRVLRRLAARLHGGVEAVDRSFEAADVIVLLNRDELRFVSDRLGHGRKAVLLPNGLTEERAVAMAQTALPPAARQREQRVVFVGHVSERKGLGDFPALVEGVRERVRDVSFSLLGTGVPPERLLPLFTVSDQPHVRATQAFEPDELPGLLANATVGVLPSYLEGFPLGLLETLAAGLPAAGYDAPGSRELLEPLGPSTLAPAGDTRSLAARVAKLLLLPFGEYAALAERSRAVAAGFRWREIARDTLQAYESARAGRAMR